MSEETYKQAEDNEERPPVNLGVPEKQPRDLGMHKIVFCGQTGDATAGEKNKPTNFQAETITIVQDEYCHLEKQVNQKDRGVRNRLVTASLICLVFISMEFVGGYFSNSLVIAADAAQLLTVFSTLMASLFALKLSSRKPSEAKAVGWQRTEVLGALVSILTTWVLTSIVVYLAFDRLVQGDFIIDVDMMLATSAFGVVANLVMGMVLHNNCPVRYVSGCNTDRNTGNKVHINVRAAFLHIVCDFLFSLGVFITALFIDCCPDWHIVDPICTVVFSVVVLFITLTILKDLLRMLVEEIPKGIYMNDVLKTLLTIEGVQQVHNLKLWALSLDKIALSAHLTIRPGVDHNEVLKSASRRIHAQYNFFEMTLHIEVFHESVMEPEKEQPPEKS